MTNPNYTQLLVIVDRSGSMFTCKNDMLGGLKAYFKDQAENAVGDDKVVVDYVQFDTEYEKVYEDRPVEYAEAVLEPRGGTALLDAIGKGVTDLGNKLRKKPESERPSNVIVVVVTDGHENSSVDWKAEDVKALVTQQENEWNWTFVFLGANMDAVSVAGGLGFRAGNSLTYVTNDPVALANTYSNLSAHTHATRSGLARDFTEDERAASVGSHAHNV